MTDHQKKYEIGFPVFQKLFNLKSKELIDTVKEIVGDEYNYLLDSDPTVSKRIDNDIPVRVKISYYDCITISPFGINYEGEHGYNSKKLVEFNKFFKL